MDVSNDKWKIGELAAATGLTVRTLHHYDEIELLRPSERSEAGHRIYTEADVRRLYRILSLRQLGFPLADITAMIESDATDPRAAVRSHLDAVEEQIELQQELRERLDSILGVLDSSAEPSTNQLLEIMEVMMEVEKYYTPEQQEQIRKRGDEADWDEIKRNQKEWSRILEDAEAAMRAGTPATDPQVQALARRYSELGQWFAAGFTGEDSGLRESLGRVWAEKGDALHSQFGKGPEVDRYFREALEA